MSRLTNESPMDFEYENRTGPVDHTSPFMQVRRTAPTSPAKNVVRKRLFDSPSRSTDNRRPLSPEKQLPPTPFTGQPAFSALFTTPHKNQNAYDDSSAGETPNNDSDATPDTGRRGGSNLARFDTATQPSSRDMERRHSPSKEIEHRPSPQKRYSWDRAVTSLKNKFSPSRYSAREEYRVDKRRKGQVDRRFRRDRRHSMSDSGEESEPPRSRTRSPRKASRQHDEALTVEAKPHSVASFFSFLAQHPTIPHVLSFYAQLVFNVCLLSFCLYLVWCFWGAVAGDVEKRSWEAQQVVIAEAAACSEQYRANHCDRATRAPALETVCENWMLCMKQDATKVKRAQVGAQTFAEIFNAFVEAISYKAMAFTFILVFGCFAISNFAFGYFRDKTVGAPPFTYPQGQHQQPQPQYFPPPTPQRPFSSAQEFYQGTPSWYQHPHPELEPTPSGGYGQIEGTGSPHACLRAEADPFTRKVELTWQMDVFPSPAGSIKSRLCHGSQVMQDSGAIGKSDDLIPCTGVDTMSRSKTKDSTPEPQRLTLTYLLLLE
nr:nucleus export protein brr6 [Quercus suber]